MGACTAITLRMYTERKQWTLDALAVDLRLYNDGNGNRIERTLTVRGLDDQQCGKLMDIAGRTPVTLALKGGVPIHTSLA